MRHWPRRISRRNGNYVLPLYRDPLLIPYWLPMVAIERLHIWQSGEMFDKGDSIEKTDFRNACTIDSSLVTDLRAPIITPPSVYQEVTRMMRYRGQLFQHRGSTDPKDGIHRSNIDETRVMARQGVYGQTTSSATLFHDASDVIYLTTRYYNQI